MNFRNAFFVLLLVFCAPAWAAGKAQYLRDAEIEGYLKEFAAPVFSALGLNPDSVRFVLVNDRLVNAFVASGSNMFFTTGLLREARNPAELIGVIAHEGGHIAGGHLVRFNDEIQAASVSSILATVFGVVAAVGSGEAGAGAAAVSLGQQVAQRSLLKYSRTQESAADQAALTALAKAEITPEGLMTFLQRLQDQELLPEDQQIEFVRTHPLTRDRVDAVAAVVRDASAAKPLPQEMDKNFRRMQAKLAGYLDPRGTLQRSGAAPKGFEARYAVAIARHQTGDTAGALSLTDALLKDEPNNPFLHELKGQVLFETGQPRLAVESYQQAVRLLPSSALLRVGLAQALLDKGDDMVLGEAVSQLEAAAGIERRSPFTWRLLATAYGRQKNMGLAAYALAEEAMSNDDKKQAESQAKRAQELLPKGSPGWLKAGDVLAGLADLPEKKQQTNP
jgi:predicted Zn-dependent protease